MPSRLSTLFCLLLVLGSATVALRAQSLWTFRRTELPGVTGATSVAFGNGRFVVSLVGKPDSPAVGWSTDGLTWYASRSNPPANSIAFIDGAFYAAEGSTVSRSTDGDTWEPVPGATRTGGMRYIASNGRGLVVSGVTASTNTLFYSPDLQTWRATASFPLPTSAVGHRYTLDVACLGDRYFACYTIDLTDGTGRNVAASMTDGDNWRIEPALANAYLLASGNGRLVAWGAFPGTIVTTDGVNFTSYPEQSPLVPTNGGRLGFAGGRFFFLGSFFSSRDGITWGSIAPTALSPISVRPGSREMVAIAHGNGRYVVVGAGTNQATNERLELIATLSGDPPLVITSQPSDRSVALGGRTTFSVTADGAGLATTYQWHRDGIALSGATDATFTLTSAKNSDAGRYSVELRNSIETFVSASALLTVVPATQAGRLTNLSVLTSLDAPDDSFSVGFVLGGTATTGSKSLLVRAVGPSLSVFGVARPVADPQLELSSSGVKIGENDNWGTAPGASSTSVKVGAFGFLAPDSKDSALVSLVPQGDSIVKISARDGTTGAVLAEVYDTELPFPASSQSPRLLNVSVLKNVAPGDILTAGFVLGGSTPSTILIRAIGPSLSAFGVTPLLADPKLTLYRAGTATPLATNDDWAGTAPLTAASTAVGAFTLNRTSKDSGLLVTLPPGNYSVQGTATNGAGGYLLVEVYEAP